MNAAETIQAAIDHLATMRDVSGWGTAEVRGKHPYCEVFGLSGRVALDLYDYDAELIVTLHRTIDAQLAILQAAKTPEMFHGWQTFDNAAVRLAEAILGEADK